LDSEAADSANELLEAYVLGDCGDVWLSNNAEAHPCCLGEEASKSLTLAMYQGESSVRTLLASNREKCCTHAAANAASILLDADTLTAEEDLVLEYDSDLDWLKF